MTIIWSSRSQSDLQDIRNYIAEDNPPAADRVTLAIVDHTNTQLQIPRLGRIGRVTGTYELVIPKLPYIVVYREIDGAIQIVRVYHTSRMWPEEF